MLRKPEADLFGNSLNGHTAKVYECSTGLSVPRLCDLMAVPWHYDGSAMALYGVTWHCHDTAMD